MSGLIPGSSYPNQQSISGAQIQKRESALAELARRLDLVRASLETGVSRTESFLDRLEPTAEKPGTSSPTVQNPGISLSGLDARISLLDGLAGRLLSLCERLEAVA